MRPEPEHLLNTGEIADVLGITRRAAHKLSARDDFPPPLGWTRGPRGRMPLWRAEEIAEWGRTADRRPGRPKA